MNKINKLNLVKDLGFVKTGVERFKGKKKYFSTSSVKEKLLREEGLFTFDEKPSRANRIVKKDDILQARMQNTNKALLINDDLHENLFSTGFFQLRPPKDKVLSKFIYYWLFSQEFNTQKDRLCSGSTQKAINDENLSKINLLVPSITLQQKIVAKLDKIFAEIDKAKDMAEANVKNAEALFQSYLNKIYDIKENLTKLKDCTKIKPPKSEIKILKGNTPVSFIPMESLGINNKFIISKQSKELEIVKGSYTYFKEDDILLAKITPCFENGKLGIANNLENGIGFGSSEYIVFRVNQNLDKEWLYYFLNRESFRRLGSKHMSGSVGHKRITKKFIEETLIPLIPIAHQKKLVRNIDNLILQSQRLKKASQNKISELFLLKNSILKQAFNGELVKAA